MNASQRMKRAIEAIVKAINNLSPARIVFERSRRQWELTDNSTGVTTVGDLAECYAEARTIGESVAFAHLAKQQTRANDYYNGETAPTLSRYLRSNP